MTHLTGQNEEYQYLQFTNPAQIQRDLQTLIGIVEGIEADQVINEIESKKLRDWVFANRDYEDRQPYKEIITVIREALADNILDPEEREGIKWLSRQYIEKEGYYCVITRAIQELIGIVKGISIDRIINPKELGYLSDWLDDNRQLANTYPYDEIHNVITHILRDQKITQAEATGFLTFADAITSGAADPGEQSTQNLTIAGIIQINPEITVPESLFCLTGRSSRFTRDELAARIVLYGGDTIRKITKKLNYLVICENPSTAWAFTTHGRKIEKAIQYRKAGLPLAIVHENDLFDALEDM